MIDYIIYSLSYFTAKLRQGATKQMGRARSPDSYRIVPSASNVITGYNVGMKLELRRVGNSLGVIVPKKSLQNWGLSEGDSLELGERGIRPVSKAVASQATQDELKRSLSLAVIRRCSPREIRAQGLANLHRWKAQGTWVSAYDEWTAILERGSDGELFAAMLGRDDNSTRLRQSMPYVGLLSPEEVKSIYEEAAG